MEDLMNCMADNKGWLFSGLGTSVIVFLLGWLLTKGNKTVNQQITSGDGSTNIQAGGDVNVKVNRGEKAQKVKPINQLAPVTTQLMSLLKVMFSLSRL